MVLGPWCNVRPGRTGLPRFHPKDDPAPSTLPAGSGNSASHGIRPILSVPDIRACKSEESTGAQMRTSRKKTCAQEMRGVSELGFSVFVLNNGCSPGKPSSGIPLRNRSCCTSHNTAEPQHCWVPASALPLRPWKSVLSHKPCVRGPQLGMKLNIFVLS